MDGSSRVWRLFKKAALFRTFLVNRERDKQGVQGSSES